MAQRSTKMVAGMLPVVFAVSGWLFLARPWEPPVDRAYRLCGECGLPSSKVDGLIGIMRENPKTRAEKLEEFRKLFDDPLDLEYCEPCAEAVLDAARKRAGIVIAEASEAGLAPWSGQMGANHGERGRFRLA